MDEKFDILRHPNVAGTADGKTEVFRHGTVAEAVASIAFDTNIAPEYLPETIATNTHYELLSEEDLQELFNPKELPNAKKQQNK
jgi:type IV secretion system protein VirD4